jgi:hypothetical protein
MIIAEMSNLTQMPVWPVMERVPMSENRNDWWKKSRQRLKQLFEEYCRDYGLIDGGKINRAIIDILGGYRLTIPDKMSNDADNNAALIALYHCLRDRFGAASGEAIMRKFLCDLKDCRISFPDHQDIYREERNRKIKNMFNGGNYKELAILYNLDESWIWRIVNEE